MMLQKFNPDVICLQEIKMSGQSISELVDYFAGEYQCAHSLSSINGRSGVCILSKIPFAGAHDCVGLQEFDAQGRFLMVELENGFQVVCLYMPHGGRDGKQIPFKLYAYGRIELFIKEHLKRGVICADFNVAHSSIDLARPSQNQNNTMFTKDERRMIDSLLSNGFADAFRIHTSEGNHYSWWPYSFSAWERNLGWRIDYIFVQQQLVKCVKNVSIIREIRCSDHSPVLMDLQE
jgi:exodeoxyribonuclease-3